MQLIFLGVISTLAAKLVLRGINNAAERVATRIDFFIKPLVINDELLIKEQYILKLQTQLNKTLCLYKVYKTLIKYCDDR